MKLEPFYQIILLGSGVAAHGEALRTIATERALAISEDLAAMLRIHSPATMDQIARNAPIVAIYLGGDTTSDADLIAPLMDKNIPILPVVSDLKTFNLETPDALHSVNGMEVDWAAPDFTAVVNVAFENLALLRRERRLFISYYRKESQDSAHRLRVALDDVGYDTFLDISSVPKGDDFQSVLMHRLLDSDVMIVLHTPNFHTSYWTGIEVAKANAMSVGILRVAWPGVKGDDFAELAQQLLLKEADFEGDTLSTEAIGRIVVETEALRARNVAARHNNLVGEFCEAAQDAGLEYVIQPHRFVIGHKKNGKRVAAIPAVGVPDAQRFHDAARRFPIAGDTVDEAVLLYDHRGMHGAWTEYLQWLDQFLPVKSLRVTNTAAYLKGAV